MVRRVLQSLVLVIMVALVAAGCGEPRQVTYVDPNGRETDGVAGDGGEPIARFGAAAAERAKAVIRMRSALAVARTQAVTDAAAASEVVRRTIEEDLPLVEARAAATAPAQAAALRDAMERLRDAPPSSVAAYNRAVRTLVDVLLARVEAVAVPAAARQDVSFRAAMLAETLRGAGTSYEASFEGGTEDITLPAEYRLAYGMLIDASTRQLEAVPEDARPAIRSALDRIARAATPGPTPPEDPRDPETVVGDLDALHDDVLIASRIDTTYPPPDPATPDQLRSLKRAMAAAVEAHERGNDADALRQLAAADRTLLVPAAAGIAALSPSLLADLERGIVFDLPAAIRSGSSVTSVAAQLDAHLDEATSLVEEELELLREAG